MIIIGISVTLPLTLMMIIIVIWVSHKKQERIIEKGVLFFKVNPGRREVKLECSKYNSLKHNKIFSDKEDVWVSLDNLTDNFKNTPGEKLFRQAYLKIKKGEQHISGSFESTNIIEKKLLVFKYTFNKINNQDEYILSIEWRQIFLKKQKDDKREIKITDLINLKTTYFGSISFFIQQKDQKSMNNFAFVLNKVNFMKKDIKYIITDRIITFIYAFDKQKSFDKKVIKLENFLKGKGVCLGLQLHYSGVSVAVLPRPTSKANIALITEIVQYQILKSIRNNAQIIKNVNKNLLEDEEFIQFRKDINNFVNSYTDPKLFKVKNKYVKKKNGKKLLDIKMIEFQNIEHKSVTNILQIDSRRKDVQNITAKEMCFGNHYVKSPFMIYVNYEWILNNHKKILNKQNIIYIIYLPSDKLSLVKDVINNLTSNGIVIGLMMYKFDNAFVSIIRELKPNFIIIHKSLIQNLLLKIDFNILSLNKMAKHHDFKIIYDELDIKTNKHFANSLDVEFYIEPDNKNSKK